MFATKASIRIKLASAFGLGLVLVIGIGFFSIFQLNIVNGVTREIRDVWFPKLEMLSVAKRTMISHSLLAKRRIQTTDFRQLATISATMRKLEADMVQSEAGYLRSVRAEQERALISNFQEEWKKYQRSFDKVLDDVEAGALSSANTEFETISLRAFDDAITNLDRLFALVENETHRAGERANRVYDHARFLVGGVVLFAVISVILAIAWVSTHITTPLLRVSDAMLRLTGGNSETVIPHYGDRHDEIGILSHAAEAYRSSVARSRELADVAETERSRLQAALSNMPVGLIMCDADKRLIVCNEKYAELNRLPPELTKPGTPFEDIADYRIRVGLYAGDDPQKFKKHLLNNIEQGIPRSGVWERHDGRCIGNKHQPLSDGGWLAIHEDITEARRAEERNRLMVEQLRATQEELRRAVQAAEASNEAKSAFLANMSHEIRTPLNGILGMAQVLESEPLSDFQKEGVHTILASGQTLMALLNDVLDLSKIEAGKLDITPVEGRLEDVFSHLYKLFLPRAQEKSLDLIVKVDEYCPEILRFDFIRVRQCVSNLISNAIKFTDQGSVSVLVTHEAVADEEYMISVAVSDTGIGISDQVARQLFSEFSQADASTSRQYGGTGLGLAISRKLARLMGGDVGVVSKLGEGSTFTLKFQAFAAFSRKAYVAAEVVNLEKRSAPSLQGLRILLVDDNAINRQVARLLLVPNGVFVTEAANGLEALKLLAEQPFDLVLLDVHMPVMDGLATIEHIRAARSPWRNISIIALTADAMSGDKERLLSIGMDGYVAKPLDQHLLMNEIFRVLSERGASSFADDQIFAAEARGL